MSKTRIVIHGAAGRMGQRLVALAAADQELHLTAAVDSPGHPRLEEDAGALAGVGIAPVPVPAAGFVLLGALGALTGLRRRKKA